MLAHVFDRKENAWISFDTLQEQLLNLQIWDLVIPILAPIFVPCRAHWNAWNIYRVFVRRSAEKVLSEGLIFSYVIMASAKNKRNISCTSVSSQFVLDLHKQNF